MINRRTERRLKSIYLTTQALSIAILGLTIAMLTSHSYQRAGIFRLTFDSGLDNDVTTTLGSILLVVKSSEAQIRIATAAFAFRAGGCAFLSMALVFVLDSYFSALSALKPDADGKIQAGLVFWSNSVVNVTFAVVLLASDIVYRKATQNWAWSGAHYTITGSAA
ncbi:hypothetical protein V2A60_008670 [Cordyceps javanica]